MSTLKSQRVLPIDSIPQTVWRGGLLRLAGLLATAYVNELDRLGLREQSIVVAEGGIHGGQSLNETLEHFARRFIVSAGRIEYSILAPTDSFAHVSDAFLSSFSDGHVAVLDIPCGTGAMSASLLTTIIALRQEGLLPRLPLTVTICAGDYSPPAREMFVSMMNLLAADASAQGVTVEWNTHDWDARRSDHTSSMIDDWLARTLHATEHFVVVSNFSGALETNNAFNAFAPCFEHILARIHNRRSTIVWIEPATKSAKRDVLTRVAEFIKRRVSWMSGNGGSNRAPDEAKYLVEHPVNRSAFPSNVVVQRFERNDHT